MSPSTEVEDFLYPLSFQQSPHPFSSIAVEVEDWSDIVFYQLSMNLHSRERTGKIILFFPSTLVASGQASLLYVGMIQALTYYHPIK